MKTKITSFFTNNIVYVLLISLIVRIALSFFGTLKLDQGTFIAWSNILVHGGLNNFYNSWSDYLPGYLYVLWLLGKINAFNIIPQVVLYKLPAILSDLATGYLIFKILSKSKNERLGIIGAVVYLLNPAVIGNSTLWGQVDSLTALTSILAIYLLDSNYILSAIVLAFGTLIKPQVAFALPVIIFLFIKEKWKYRKIFLYGLTGLAIFILGFLPFSNGNLFSFIVQRLGISANQYPYTSVNAFNFWGIFGFWMHDNSLLQIAGYVFVLIFVFLLCSKLWNKKEAKYYLLTFIFAASFIFFTRIHERHLLPVIAPLTIVALENPVFMIPLIGFSLTYVANLYYSYIWVSNNFKEIFSGTVIKLISLLNVGILSFTFFAMISNLKLNINKFLGFFKSKNIQNVPFPKIKFQKKTLRWFLAGILVFAFATRVFGLNYPTHEYFDEVYHAFTAKVILHGDPKAWEWWNTPPEGFAYEWTHPPLAKLGMVAGMLIFGENSFGYRIPGALLGVGAVLLVYLLAKELFNDEAVGLLSAAVFSLDGLALVMSRIGMNDSYILFFSLLSIYLFLKQKDFLSAASFGLAIASKWSAIWAIPILFVIWLRRKNKFHPTVLWFFLLPLAIYLLSYTPMFLTGHSLDTWWGMQEQMWWYHTGLRATHPYSSMWWSWPFLVRPIYLYTSQEINGVVARIYAFGNPVVFWFGFASIIFTAIYAFIEKNKNLGLVVFSYLIFFVPWALSPRIMFLYHYLPSIPFLAIATGYVLRRNSKLIFGYLFICLLVFIYFYPHWAGLSVPLWLDRSYYWLPSWR